MKKIFTVPGTTLGIPLLGILILLAYWYFRPNRTQVNTTVVVDSWDIANDGQHNSNTDMIRWNGEIYIAYVSSPYHFSSEDSTLHIKHSNDLGRTWVEDSTFNPDENDIRDPKFLIIGNRLFLYALDNKAFNPEPNQTVYSYTENGKDWSPLEIVPGVDGWLFCSNPQMASTGRSSPPSTRANAMTRPRSSSCPMDACLPLPALNMTSPGWKVRWGIYAARLSSQFLNLPTPRGQS